MGTAVRLADDPALQRIDVFAYRHRLSEVMSQPLITVEPDRTLSDAARLMTARGVSSLVIIDGDGRPAGILTERDLTRAAADSGRLFAKVGACASSPVATIRSDEFVHVAIARLDRLGYRHLVVVTPDGRGVGMVTVRSMLHQRASAALALGDEIEAARDAADLTSAWDRMPKLARGLLDEDMAAPAIAEVISAVVRELTRKSVELAVMAMADSHGPPAASFAVLVLGSGGRGESLLAADQDNAIVHAGRQDDDPWFAELGRRLADNLDGAGVPYCKGGVMAREAPWRHSFDSWQAVVAGWTAAASPKDLLSADIFFDFRVAFGDVGLVDRLRKRTLAQAAGSPMLISHLTADLASVRAPIGFFGNFKTDAGRIDLKRNGLFPVVAAVRARALARHIAATSTSERIAYLEEAGDLPKGDAASLKEALSLFLTLILDQQTRDVAAGKAPGNRIEVALLDSMQRRRLKEALGYVETFVQAAAGRAP